MRQFVRQVRLRLLPLGLSVPRHTLSSCELTNDGRVGVSIYFSVMFNTRRRDVAERMGCWTGPRTRHTAGWRVIYAPYVHRWPREGRGVAFGAESFFTVDAPSLLPVICSSSPPAYDCCSGWGSRVEKNGLEMGQLMYKQLADRYVSNRVRKKAKLI